MGQWAEVLQPPWDGPRTSRQFPCSHDPGLQWAGGCWFLELHLKEQWTTVCMSPLMFSGTMMSGPVMWSYQSVWRGPESGDGSAGQALPVPQMTCSLAVHLSTSRRYNAFDAFFRLPAEMLATYTGTATDGTGPTTELHLLEPAPIHSTAQRLNQWSCRIPMGLRAILTETTVQLISSTRHYSEGWHNWRFWEAPVTIAEPEGQPPHNTRHQCFQLALNS